MNVTVCDFDGCENVATSHVTVFGGPEVEDTALEDWAGMEFDTCTDHDGLGPWVEIWERQVAQGEAEAS